MEIYDRDNKRVNTKTVEAKEQRLANQYIKKNGEIMDALLSAITENDENGELIYSLSVIIDVTDRKKAEVALRENEEKLRNIVEYSTNLFYSHL